MAARNATPEQREMLQAITSPEIPERGTVKFHKMLADCTSNEVFRLILAAVNQLVGWQTDLEHLTDDEVHSEGRTHAAIVAAILDGDDVEASRLMLKHIEAFERVMEAAGRLDQPSLPRERWIAYRRGAVPS